VNTKASQIESADKRDAVEPKPLVEAVNILLVDDNERNLDVLESLLASVEIKLVRAKTPEEALLGLLHGEFACIILDIQMPSMNGLDLARLIKTRKRSQHIPIIFLTAYFSEEKDVLLGYGAGAVDYLTKPINPEILRSKVGVYVDLFRKTLALARVNEALELEVSHRKKAEEALRDANAELEIRVQRRTADLSLSEQRYRQVVYNLPVAVYVTDIEGRVALFNEAAVHLWGREPEIGKDIWDGRYKIFRMDGSLLPRAEYPMIVTMKTGTSVRGEEIIIEWPDGHRRNVLPYPEPFCDESGQVIGAVNMLVDITERKKSEEAARRLAAIVQWSDDAIISKDTHGIVTSWNDGAQRLFGYEAEEILGKSIATLIPPERQDEETEILKNVHQGNPIRHFETVRVRKNGTFIDVSLTISPVKDAEGVIIGASKIARDISDRRRTERQQKALYELVAAVNRALSLPEVCDAALEAVFQCLEVDRAAILLRDSQDAMRFVSWRALSEIYRTAVEGHSPWTQDEADPQAVFINEIKPPALDEPLCEVVRQEGIGALAFIPITYQKRLLGKFMIYFDAPHQFTTEEVRPVQTIASQIAFAIERQRVLQQLKKAHAETLEASRAKDNFLATLSHELRTPLNPILLIASDAINNTKLSPDILADFEMIRKNVELEARLIDDLLDLTRITHGKIALEKKHCDLHSILKDAISNVCDVISQKKILLDLRLNASEHTVFADSVRLHQVFGNLLNNAAKFTPAGGKILVETHQSEGKTITVKVVDTGIGMKPEEIGRLFAAFSQGNHADGNEKHRFGGLGLGLAISQKLLEFHSGKIYATSAGLDLGSTFTIELPLAQSRPGESSEDPEQSAETLLPGNVGKTSATRILLVEDHEPTRNTLSLLLIRRGYEVITSSSFNDAIAVSQKHNFHLLISDIGLPDGNGYDLMERLKQNLDIKGIALTGYGMEQDIGRSQKAGFITHLTKPIRMETLDAALNSILQPPVETKKQGEASRIG
jgi:PAS domain S-box-containing protein